ncbi:MAG: IPT/TIG domain-containing protein [Methylococcus sp.]|nr:IPT/TIG domain-containing protein [Methylococcus sp.]
MRAPCTRFTALLLLVLSNLLAAAPVGAAKPVMSSISPQSGDEGTVVTLSGENFGSEGKVLFGQRQATVSSWSDQLIEVVAPKGHGVKTVRVKSKPGSKSNALIFTYPKKRGGGTPAPVASAVKVFANNNLGMHCVDKSFEVLSLLPPFNVVNAQVVGQDGSGNPVLLGADRVYLRYSPIADGNGSQNSTSIGKSDFWNHAKALFGTALNDGEGLTGLYMPADAPAGAPPALDWKHGTGLFSAAGIPILPVDDAYQTNRFPLMRIVAYDKANDQPLGSVDTVLPVSDETDCHNCHAAGKAAAIDPSVNWATPSDVSNGIAVENAARLNILKLHDKRAGTRLENSQPVLCAGCHYSPALDIEGTGPAGIQQALPTLSAAMHGFHAGKLGNTKDQANAPGQSAVTANEQACYECHPGRSTQCLRGAMTNSLTCQNCHGNMEAVGAKHTLHRGGDSTGHRQPWSDEPLCQSCHTGDAVSHNRDVLASDGLRAYLAYDPADPAATPRHAANQRFAEDKEQLFQHSQGHGGLACEACHGSTHAIWPAGGNRNPNDNVAAKQLQGHIGTITECGTCHKAALPLNLNGPHGMHVVGDSRWQRGHERAYKSNPTACQACHGADYRGSPLSRAATDRVYNTGEFGVKQVKKGNAVTCYTCHNGPRGGD